MKGVAAAEIRGGVDPSTMFHCLALVAIQWDDHPDFQSSWRSDYVRA